jgi:acyl-CoA reductase-like NAD-dependent aldehyde dehydrogenase
MTDTTTTPPDPDRGPTGLAMISRAHLNAQLAAFGITTAMWTSATLAQRTEVLSAIANVIGTRRDQVVRIAMVNNPATPVPAP